MKRWLTSSRGQKVLSRREKYFTPMRVNKDLAKLSQKKIIGGSVGRSSQGRQGMRMMWMILPSFLVLRTVQSEG